MKKLICFLASSAAMLQSPAALAQPAGGIANPALWPSVRQPLARDARLEARIEALLSRMSVEDKVGQLIQVDIASIRPEDLRTYKLGSVLNGGNSGPNGNDKAPAPEWLALSDAYYEASMERRDGRPRIPVIWGTDAVHGNNNVRGATLFPHNIGLGAARNPELVRRIGEVTAIETIVAGQHWSFAPTVAVARDDRWGRTYESYSENPDVVNSYAGAVVEGLQGKAGSRDFLSPSHVVSSTKHFLADGGTDGGQDQGNATISEQALIDIHYPGYASALAAGTQIIMASFSSWNGSKLTGNKSLLTDVLKGRLGFDGFVVSDWNAHGQLPGCTTESCASAINAGLDMFMYSGDGWKTLYDNTLAQVRSGEIPQTRLDDAVRRILRVKLRAGLFEAGKPSERPLAGKWNLLGAPEHRALARQAVRESMVLLKNEGGVLPLKPSANILVAGKGADSIAQAAGGWSITWQGDNVTNDDFPNGQSIWSGIKQLVDAAGGTATLSADGSFQSRPDAAIVVFGEQPYAEFRGDRPNLEFSPADKSDLALLRKLKAAGVPVVAVFLSGRPLWVNAELNASDAFVAAFLPGTEGGGVADLLFQAPKGGIAHDFKGKLSFSWPKRPDQYDLNVGLPSYDPLFAFGYGLTYAAAQTVPQLDETRPVGAALGGNAPVFARGRLPDGWRIALYGSAEMPRSVVTGTVGALGGTLLTIGGVDRRAQEDARQLSWSGAMPAALRIEANRAVDLSSQVAAGQDLVVELRVDEGAAGSILLGMASGETAPALFPLAPLAKGASGSWQTVSLPLRCLAKAGLDPMRVTAPLVLASTGAAKVSLSDVRFEPGQANATCPTAGS